MKKFGLLRLVLSGLLVALLLPTTTCAPATPQQVAGPTATTTTSEGAYPTPRPTPVTAPYPLPTPRATTQAYPEPQPTPTAPTPDPFAGFRSLMQQGLPHPTEAHQVLMNELLAYLQTLPQGLDSLTDPEALARLPSQGPWRSQPDEREFRLADLNGDGALELLVALVPPASIVRQTPEGFAVEDLPGPVYWPPDFSLPVIEPVTDLTGDGRPEIVLTHLFGAGSYNDIELLVLGRENEHRAEWLRVSLNTWAGGGEWWLEPQPDGTQAVVTTCGVLGVFDHKLITHPMQRDIYRWNGERFVLAGSEQDPPAYRRQMVNVAEAALRAGAYRVALATYRRLLDEPDLPDDPLESNPMTEDHPDWVAYATLRTGQIQALLGERDAALIALAQAEAAGSTVGRLARRFRETYQATADPAAAWAALLTDTEIFEEQHFQRGNLVTVPGEAFGVLYAGMALAATLNDQRDALDKGTEALRAAWRERGLDVKALLIVDLDGDGQMEIAVVQPVALPSSGATSGEAAAWLLGRGPDGWFAARLQRFAGQGDGPLEGPWPVPGTQRQAVQMHDRVWSWDGEQVIWYQDAQTWRVIEETEPPSCDVRWQGISQPTQTPAPTSRLPPPPGLVYRTTDGLWRVEAGGHPVRLFDHADARLSPDGTRVLYTQANDLWLADLRTGGRRNLTRTPDRIECCPLWWPTRSEVVFFGSWPQETQELFGNGFLTMVEVDGSGCRVLDNEKVLSGPPAPAPDGQTIAYDRGTTWLYRWDVGSEPFDPVEYGLPGLEGEYQVHLATPAWSPDGKRLAGRVVGLSHGVQVGIGVFDLETQTSRLWLRYRPVGMGGFPPAPVWSPDGRWLAFHAAADGPIERGLWVVRADGGENHFLGMGGDPVWSPDGRRLAFNRSGPGVEWSIWLAEVRTWRLWPVDLPPRATPVDWRTVRQ